MFSRAKSILYFSFFVVSLVTTLWSFPAMSASPACDIPALQTFVNGNGWPMTVLKADINTVVASTVQYCDVIVDLVTDGEGAGQGLAGIEIGLPLSIDWNGKYLFLGNGGLAGSLYLARDGSLGLSKGYAVAQTDMGHKNPSGNPFDSSWAYVVNPDGSRSPNTPALIDYFYRATHQTTSAGKEFVEAFYNKKIQYSYYQGCSTGGRQGLMEAQRYPEDFDGVIAGAPVMNLTGQGLYNVKVSFSFMKPNTAWISVPDLAKVDAAVYAACDPKGYGVIQNPLTCNFNLESLRCRKDGSNAATCLTNDQVTGLIRYGRPVISEKGQILMPGAPLTDLAATLPVVVMSPYGPDINNNWFSIDWLAGDGGMKDQVFLDPDYDTRSFPISFDKKNRGVVEEWARRLNDEKSMVGNAYYPWRMKEFIKKNGKIILYHGLSDSMINPFQTMQFYGDLATLVPAGYNRLQENARLFMVPDMGHCSGGPGPNTFDMLTQLEEWIEGGKEPDSIIATNMSSGRTMPLCKFPEVATYIGGDKNVASSWKCNPHNRDLLKLGEFGRLAGFPYSYLTGQEVSEFHP
jgi:feruloyl esterase